MNGAPAITWRSLAAWAGVTALVYVLLTAALVLIGGPA